RPCSTGRDVLENKPGGKAARSWRLHKDWPLRCQCEPVRGTGPIQGFGPSESPVQGDPDCSHPRAAVSTSASKPFNSSVGDGGPPLMGKSTGIPADTPPAHA